MSDDRNTGDPQPSQSDRVSAAWAQLNLVLSFFARIDTKLSVIVGINLGAIALLATRLPTMEELTPEVSVLCLIYLVPLAISFYHIWNGYFPDLKGGTNSLIYFGSVAKMTESSFREACVSRGLRDLEADILDQCWRNSKILTCKFHSLRLAYLFAVVAIIPWVALIAELPPLQK